MGVDGALGLSGGAGGVEDIGRVLRQQGRHRRRLRGSGAPCRRVRVQQHAVQVIALAQQRGGVAVRKQRTRLCIGEHAGQARGRQIRVQRQIGAAGF